MDQPNSIYKFQAISDEDDEFEKTIADLVNLVNVQTLGQWKEKCRLNPAEGNVSFRQEYGEELANFLESKVSRDCAVALRTILKVRIEWPVEKGPKPQAQQSYEYQQCLDKIDKVERYILQQVIPDLRTGETRMERRIEMLPEEALERKKQILQQVSPELISELSLEQKEVLVQARRNQRNVWVIRNMDEEYVMSGNQRLGEKGDDRFVVAVVGLLDEFKFITLENDDGGSLSYRLTAKGIKAANTCEAEAAGLLPETNNSTSVATRQPPKVEKAQSNEQSFWQRVHPAIVVVAKPRFESLHYADSVEASFKEVNKRVKDIYRTHTGSELDGHGLMTQAFSPTNPVIALDDLNTQSGKDIQKGFMQIFAGSMTGIRNPKAHDNIVIDENRTIHFLYLASLLMYKLDESSIPASHASSAAPPA